MGGPFCYTCGEYHFYGSCFVDDPEQDDYPCDVFHGPLGEECNRCGQPEEDHPESYSHEDHR